MELLFLISGIVVIVLVTIDFLITTLRMGGGGFISSLVSKGLWNMIFFLAKKNAKSPLLSIAGFLILIKLITTWLLLIWLGFSLIYLSDANSVLETSNKIPTDTVGNIYFVGYILSSLGNGDLMAGSDFWRILTNLMSFYGFFFITLTITYILPVLDAAIKKRTLSAYIYQLGNNPVEILKNGWNGENFDMLYDQFKSLHTLVLDHTERHLAYPILHYFHSQHPKYAAPLTLAILDETITIQEMYQLDKSTAAYNWKILRQSIDAYLDVLSNSEAPGDQENPPFPYRKNLQAFPVSISENEEQQKIEKLSKRRKRWARLIKNGGWEWEDLTGH